MNRKRNSRTEKLEMSTMAETSAYKICWKACQCLASLTTLKSLRARIALMIPAADSISIVIESVKSMRLMTTMTASNALNLSRMYTFKPSPISLVMSSAVKTQTNIMSQYARIFSCWSL